jgi:hypothetical protein
MVARSQALSLRAALVATNLALLPVLAISYAQVVYPPKEYLGFTLLPDEMRMVEAMLMTLIASILAPLNDERPAAFFTHLLVVGGLLPNAVYFAMTTQPRFPMYVMATSILIVILVVRGEWSVRIPSVKGGPTIAIALALLTTAFVIVTYLVQFGPPKVDFNLYDVYELRREAADTGRTGYVSTWAAGIFNPFLLAWFLSRRSIPGVFLAFFAQVTLFLYSGAKVALFQPLLVLVVFALFHTRRPALMLSISMGLFTVAITGLSAGQPELAEIISDFSIRRVLFVPAFLNFGYFDFFGGHPKIGLTSSILARVGDYPYGDMTTGQLVADFMVLGPSNATNGFLATGFMHFGVLGACAFACLTGLLIKLADCFRGRVSTTLIVAAGIGPYRALFTESDLPTALVTHGLLITIVLYWLLQQRATAASLDLSSRMNR